MASNRKGPVLKWENNVAWPGKLTLTDKALYFEVIIVLYFLSPSGRSKLVNTSVLHISCIYMQR